MRQIVAFIVLTGVFGGFMTGCSEHATSTTKQEIKTPGGTTTITTEKDVKKTGDHKDK